ncbi:MAG TPA: hypothetical protein PLL10_02610, partial [Elusimicrobiales bacterium]|nr:hypothetical protein [Elusimicrobiales bacterium]
IPFYKIEYWRWFILNPPLFLINCGLGVAVAAIAAGVKAPARLLRGEAVFMEAISAVVLLGSLLFFNILGIAGAEASRLWLYLMPFTALLAASYCVESREEQEEGALLGVSVVQAAATSPVAGFVVP